jgi:hypothetical protein
MLLLPSEDGHNWPKHVKALYKEIYTKSHGTVLSNNFIIINYCDGSE